MQMRVQNNMMNTMKLMRLMSNPNLWLTVLPAKKVTQVLQTLELLLLLERNALTK